MIFDINLDGESDGFVRYHHPVVSPLPIRPFRLMLPCKCTVLFRAINPRLTHKMLYIYICKCVLLILKFAKGIRGIFSITLLVNLRNLYFPRGGVQTLSTPPPPLLDLHMIIYLFFFYYNSIYWYIF